MIVRVLTARVAAPDVAALNQLLRAQLTELREQPGLVYGKLARRLLEDNGEEIVLFEEWRTPADLWMWTSGRLAKPRLLPGTEALITELRIDHFESLDVLPEEFEAPTDDEVQHPAHHAGRTGATIEQFPPPGSAAG